MNIINRDLRDFEIAILSVIGLAVIVFYSASAETMNVTITIVKGATSQGCEMTKSCFRPDEARVGADGSVTWTDNDIAPHTVISAIGGIFDSGIFPPGKAFSYTFKTSGMYDYWQIHPWMIGRVIMGEGAYQPPQSPLKQFKSGIPIQNIECNRGYQLTIKSSNHSPACFQPSTVWKMLGRGWVLVESEKNDLNVNYGAIPQETTTVLILNSTKNDNREATQIYPQTISLISGLNATVTFMNEDLTKHFLQGDNQEFVSRIIEPGGKWVHTFNTPGIYHYHANLSIQGTIEVHDNKPAQELMLKFHSKLISKDKALKILQDYLDKNNLHPEGDVRAMLTYALLSKGYSQWYHINPATGLPVEEVPGWWAELQKDYLGMPNHRIEDGKVVWFVTYSTCSYCIYDKPIFFVDAITGEVVTK